MGKSSGGPVGPSPQEEFTMAKNYWEDYSKWSQQETANLERDIGRYKAQYAGSGGAGGGMTGKLIADRTAKYDTSMKELQSGERGRTLKSFEKDIRTAYKNAYSLGTPEQQSAKGDAAGIVLDSTFGSVGKGGKFDKYIKLDEADQKLVNRGRELSTQIGKAQTTLNKNFADSAMDSHLDMTYGVRQTRQQANLDKQLEPQRAELADIQSQLTERTKAIDAMSMEQLYERQFGKASIGPGDAEQAALDRAKSYGGGRKPTAGGGGGTTAPSSFFASEDAAGWW